MPNKILEGIKSIVDESNVLSGWALAILGGTILILVSTSYIRPTAKRIRLVYLLFIPGWFFLAYSMYYGDSISRQYIAAVFTSNEEILMTIGFNINAEFARQLNNFSFGIMTFIIWLVTYLCWWIFGNWTIKYQ